MQVVQFKAVEDPATYNFVTQVVDCDPKDIIYLLNWSPFLPQIYVIATMQ